MTIIAIGNYLAPFLASQSSSVVSVSSPVISQSALEALLAGAFAEGVAASVDLAPAVTGGVLPISYTVSGVPAGMVDDGDGTISGTPSGATSGEITLFVSDANGATASATAAYNITPAAAPPVAAGALADLTLTQNVAMTPVDLAADFSGGAPITYALAPSSAALPAGLSLSGAGVLSGSPTATATAASIVVRGTNADGFADSAFSLTVSAAATANPFALYAWSGDYTDDAANSGAFGVVPAAALVLDVSTINTAGTPLFTPIGPAYSDGSQAVQISSATASWHRAEMRDISLSAGQLVRIAAIVRNPDVDGADKCAIFANWPGGSESRTEITLSSGGVVHSSELAGVVSDVALADLSDGWKRLEVTFAALETRTDYRFGINGFTIGGNGLIVARFGFADAMPPLFVSGSVAVSGDVLPLGDVAITAPTFRAIPEATVTVRKVRAGSDVGDVSAARHVMEPEDLAAEVRFDAIATNASGALRIEGAPATPVYTVNAVRYVDPASVASTPAPVSVVGGDVAAALVAAKDATAGGKAYPSIVAAAAGLADGTLIVVKGGTEAAPIVYDGNVQISASQHPIAEPVVFLSETYRGARIRGANTGASGSDYRAVRLVNSANIHFFDFQIEGRGGTSASLGDPNPIQIEVGTTTYEAEGGIKQGFHLFGGCRVHGSGVDMVKATNVRSLAFVGLDVDAANPEGSGIDFVSVFDAFVRHTTIAGSARNAFQPKAGSQRISFDSNHVSGTYSEEAISLGGAGKSRSGVSPTGVGTPRAMPFADARDSYKYAECHDSFARGNFVENAGSSPALSLQGVTGARISGNWFAPAAGQSCVVSEIGLVGYWYDQGVIIQPILAEDGGPLASADEIYTRIAADYAPAAGHALVIGELDTWAGVDDFNMRLGCRENIVVDNHFLTGRATFADAAFSTVARLGSQVPDANGTGDTRAGNASVAAAPFEAAHVGGYGYDAGAPRIATGLDDRPTVSAAPTLAVSSGGGSVGSVLAFTGAAHNAADVASDWELSTDGGLTWLDVGAARTRDGFDTAAGMHALTAGVAGRYRVKARYYSGANQSGAHTTLQVLTPAGADHIEVTA